MPEEEPGNRGANENKRVLSLGEAGQGGKDGPEAGPRTEFPSETEPESGPEAQREKADCREK